MWGSEDESLVGDKITYQMIMELAGTLFQDESQSMRIIVDKSPGTQLEFLDQWI